MRFVARNLLLNDLSKIPLDFALGTVWSNGEVLFFGVKIIHTIKVGLSNIVCNVINQLRFQSIKLIVKSFALGNATGDGVPYTSKIKLLSLS